jgi:hypothetical protein
MRVATPILHQLLSSPGSVFVRLGGGLAAALILSATGGLARADTGLHFEVQRISDTQARISASGTIDVDVSASWIVLESATSPGDSGNDFYSGNFTLGGMAPQAVFSRNGTENFVLVFPAPVGLGDVAAGSMTVTLDVEAWHAVGTSGVVSAFLPQGPSHVPIGTYTIVNPMLPLGAVAECAYQVGSVLPDADGETD